MTTSISRTNRPPTAKLLQVGLWAAQAIVSIIFCFGGFAKLTTPIVQLSAMMPWTAELPENIVRILGLIDLAGGIGILLPAASRILPQLTVLAACGCAVLQVCAIIFHIFRGEFSVLLFNFILLPLALLVLWGRWWKAPILPR